MGCFRVSFAFEDGPPTLTGGIVVGRGGTVFLLFLVLAVQCNSEEGRKKEKEPEFVVSTSTLGSTGRIPYAPMIATAKAAVCNLASLALRLPNGEYTPLVCLPPLANTTIAMNAPRKATSSRIARKAKKVMPARKQVRMVAKAV